MNGETARHGVTVPAAIPIVRHGADEEPVAGQQRWEIFFLLSSLLPVVCHCQPCPSPSVVLLSVERDDLP